MSLSSFAWRLSFAVQLALNSRYSLDHIKHVVFKFMEGANVWRWTF